MKWAHPLMKEQKKIGWNKLKKMINEVALGAALQPTEGSLPACLGRQAQRS